MKNNGASNLPNAVIAFGLGAIGGAISVLLARKETREQVLAQGSQSLDYLKEHGKKFRAGTEGIIAKGKELMSQRCCSFQATTGNGTQAQEEAKPDERDIN